MPALSAWRRTVLTSHCSSSVFGVSISCMPVVRFAIHLEIISEISEPPKPKMTANTSRVPLLPRLMPKLCSTLSTMLSSARTARLVARNKAIRLNILKTL